MKPCVLESMAMNHANLMMQTSGCTSWMSGFLSPLSPVIFPPLTPPRPSPAPPGGRGEPDLVCGLRQPVSRHSARSASRLRLFFPAVVLKSKRASAPIPESFEVSRTASKPRSSSTTLGLWSVEIDAMATDPSGCVVGVSKPNQGPLSRPAGRERAGGESGGEKNLHRYTFRTRHGTARSESRAFTPSVSRDANLSRTLP